MWKRSKTHKSNAFINMKSHWVMRFREAIAFYSDNLTKHRQAVGSNNNGFDKRVTGLLVTVTTAR
jgi:hypothetical protein